MGEKGKKKTDQALRERLRGWILYYWSLKVHALPSKQKLAEQIRFASIGQALEERRFGIDLLARVRRHLPGADLNDMFDLEPPQVRLDSDGIPLPQQASPDDARRRRQGAPGER